MREDIVNGMFNYIYKNSEKYSDDPALNIVGWHSSFTGEEIPKNEMEEWRKLTVVAIMETPCDSILEVACGTGILLFALREHYQRYAGIDVAEEAINYIQRHIENDKKTQVYVAPASKLSEMQLGLYQMGVMNSASQYMGPAEAYEKVIESFIEKIEQGGTIFLGDLKRSDLKQEFYRKIELEKNEAAVSDEKLQMLITKRSKMDMEFYIDMDYILSLQNKFPRIATVEGRLKKGTADNEMMMFRFDAVLHLDKAPDFEYIQLECGPETSLGEITAFVTEHPTENVKISYVFNKHMGDICGKQSDSYAAYPFEADQLANGREARIHVNAQETKYHFDILVLAEK